ncbi:MAG TPA: aminopeptidase [Cyanobacteria bacterium UBA8530]|nr:aminopeptidase [Cyanobacteria bacterium UBA8530]
MHDPTVLKMAKTILNYSFKIKAGDFLFVECESVSQPLLAAVYEEAVKMGINVDYHVNQSAFEETFFQNASEEQVKFQNPLMIKRFEEITHLLTIWGTSNAKSLASIDPRKLQAYALAKRPWKEIFYRRLGEGTMEWCGTQFPTFAEAQEAGMSISDYQEFLFQACMVDREDPIAAWSELEERQQSLVDSLNKCDEFEIVAPDTHLTLRTGGRKWVNSSGHANFPSGEVFTSPVETSVSGKIRFSFPGIYMGREIEDIRLTFVDGKVVQAEAAKGQDLLQTLLETDEGASMVGEFAFGTNPGITRFTRNMLFDEKIGGTIHLALGEAFAESLGVNKSAIHWDMLCDMRSEGKVYADGRLIYENGAFLPSLHQ